MSTIDITTIGDSFTQRIRASVKGPCRHFSIELDGGFKSWELEPEFICADCRARFSYEQALAIREMHEIRT